MAEKNYAFVDAHEYRDLVEDSCMNYRRGQVIDLIGQTIKRNIDPEPAYCTIRRSKYGVVVKDPDTVIDCILTILEIVEPWSFRQIINDWPKEDDGVPEESPLPNWDEDEILPDSAEVENYD